MMFKAIANSGSQATSVQEAEHYALQYFWYFMLLTAFVFTGLAEGAISIYSHWSTRFELILICLEIFGPLSIYLSFLLASSQIPNSLGDGTLSNQLEVSFDTLLRSIADNTPLRTAATWLNWIIVRCVLIG